jgi:hypothetical protein
MPYTASSIAYVTPTVCALLGIDAPALAVEPACAGLLDAARNAHGAGPLTRLLLYAPDAIGMHLVGKYAPEAAKLRAAGPEEVRTRAVLPSVTPVCFATMFTGAPPNAHGIEAYEKPVLKCDTLFDALLRAGKRVAIVAVAKCSIDIIFRGRELDYYSEDYDREVTARTLALLTMGQHDVILAYHQEYDDQLHRTVPESPECLAAFRRHAESFRLLTEAAARCWEGQAWGAACTPDHGAHINPETGKGTHGSDCEDDLALAHFWRFG